MKTILVPTDFSATSLNAAKYAAQLAKTIEAEILLYHVCHPVMASDGYLMVTMDEIEKEANNSLNKLKKNLKEEFGQDLKMGCYVNSGLLIDQISEVSLDREIDLIVMGISGAGKTEEVLFGSNTISIMHNTNCPAIIVPLTSEFKPIKKIVFACDYDISEDYDRVNEVVEYTKLFNASLDVVYINTTHQLLSLKKAIEGINLENEIESVEHNYFFIEGDNVIEGINDFVARHNSNLIVMFPKKHNVLERIMQKSDTKKMAFHAGVPLLTIH